MEHAILHFRIFFTSFVVKNVISYFGIINGALSTLQLGIDFDEVWDDIVSIN